MWYVLVGFLQHVLDKERRGDYLGKTVQVCQYSTALPIKKLKLLNSHKNCWRKLLHVFWKPPKVIPHITDAIQEWIERVALIPVDGREGRPEVCIVELAGTIGLGIQTQFLDDPIVFVHLRKRKFIPNCAGDIESRPFMEALSQFSYRAGNILWIFGGLVICS